MFAAVLEFEQDPIGVEHYALDMEASPGLTLRWDDPRPRSGDVDELAAFTVHAGGKIIGRINCTATYSAMSTSSFFSSDPADTQQMRELIAGYTLQRAEAVLGTPSALEELAETGSNEFVLDSFNIEAELGAMATAKVCDYQERVGRDLWCTAASRKDETASAVVDDKTAAPTSIPICADCPVVDARTLCSHFMHPEIIGARSSGGVNERLLSWALCDQGHQDRVVNTPELCRPTEGGHDCWERVVAPTRREPQGTLDPVAVPEALDHLSDVWRLAFGNRLVEPRSAADLALLTQPALSREELGDRLRALGEVIDALVVTDESLPEDLAAEHRRGSLNRIESALRTRVNDQRQATLVTAVATLRAVKRLDNALTHPTGELPALCATLHIPYPPSDWDRTWRSIRLVTLEAVRVLTRATRWVADLG